LYPLAIADALMSVAAAGSFSARWTKYIESEWVSALERARPELVGRLDFRRECMREACQDWEVPEAAWGPLVASLVLPDPDDRHVLAAAIAGHADYIVTLNLRDFPQAAAAKFGIEVVDPDTFLLNQWDLEPEVAAAAFQSMRERRRRPEFGPDDFARALQAGGLPLVAQRFREVVMA
jgi:hypothetical protein